MMDDGFRPYIEVIVKSQQPAWGSEVFRFYDLDSAAAVTEVLEGLRIGYDVVIGRP